ncbi:MAG: rod shape-determining protein RodA [Deltaproteobacteria bacterium RBG_13_47_9]|nr:MAG: rod shape-determining protein RodA [Deltaproteobacteria bacterium RBG_13_47_9]
MIDRRLFIHFDWTLLGIVLLIASIGILNLYSASSNEEMAGTSLYIKQLSWLLIGLAIMAIVAFIDYRIYVDFAYIIYGMTFVLLIVVLGYGIITSGAQRWVRIGWLSFQPSEFVKISLIFALAKFFQRPPGREGYSLKNLSFPFLLLFLPTVLILKQPDLGTAIILVLVFSSTLLFVKIRWSSWLVIVLAGTSFLPLLWGFLKDYQKRRIFIFFNPDLDPLGSGYHIIQSKIAIGSGGILGKGFMKGTQSRLGFLPEQQTDFIFSAFGEEWGLMGSLILLGLYFLLILWGLRISVQSKDRLGAVLAFGFVAMLFWHIFINIGMVLGIMPVVGIPLPFLSYGGSFLISTLIGIGLLLNVSMRRYLF